MNFYSPRTVLFYYKNILLVPYAYIYISYHIGEASSSIDDTEVPKPYKTSSNHCTSAISPSSMIDSRIELKPLLNHSMHKTRVTSRSQGILLPFHTHEDQTLNDSNIPSSNEPVIKNVNFQDQPMIRTVIFNL